MAGANSGKASSVFPIMKMLIFTVLVPGTVGVYLPYWMLASRQTPLFEEMGAAQIAGGALIAFGALGYFWCAWNFAWTGRGTPAPIDPPKVLVARGLYRHVRNPMYISVGLVVIGESLLFKSTVLLRYVLLFWALAHLFVILYEEPTLRSKFGESYEEYCKNVPRWIPRFRHTAR